MAKKKIHCFHFCSGPSLPLPLIQSAGAQLEDTFLVIGGAVGEAAPFVVQVGSVFRYGPEEQEWEELEELEVKKNQSPKQDRV